MVVINSMLSSRAKMIAQGAIIAVEGPAFREVLVGKNLPCPILFTVSP
jgi:hypothetical protein